MRKEPLTTPQKMRILQRNGIDTSKLLSFDDNGAHMPNGYDPVFDEILANGTLHERRLFRRWITSQTLKLYLSCPDQRRLEAKIANMARRNFRSYYLNRGRQKSFYKYNYMWQVIFEEMKTQRQMLHHDPETFALRRKFFNEELIREIIRDWYIAAPFNSNLDRFTSLSHTRELLNKGVPFYASQMQEACQALARDGRKRFKRTYPVKGNLLVPEAFVKAYLASGFFFTLQNLFLFNGFTVRGYLLGRDGATFSGNSAFDLLKICDLSYENLYRIFEAVMEQNKDKVAGIRKAWHDQYETLTQKN